MTDGRGVNGDVFSLKNVGNDNRIGDLRIEDSCLTPTEVRRHLLDGAPGHTDSLTTQRFASATARDTLAVPDVARAS